jgi:fido (protein-threonine AMPylation protein)
VSDEDDRLADEKARQAQREADLVLNRIRELHAEPIQGNFDAEHLKAVHAYIFQDLPKHQPGVIRNDTAETWIKHRALEGRPGIYDVPYVSQGVEAHIANALDQFGGAEAIKGLPLEAAAGRLAELYADLDHAHGFYEGNSRTLREFTRELAKEAGFNLDWTGTSVSEQQRNELYIARDLAVLERAYPDLTPEKAMQTNDRTEYEASFVMEGLRSSLGDKSLTAMIGNGLSLDIQREQGQEPDPGPFDRTAAAPVAEGVGQPHGMELESKDATEGLVTSSEREINAMTNKAEQAAAVLDGIADIAGGAIETIADTFAELLGGGPSAPAPPRQAPEQKPLTMEEFLAREQQQRDAAKQELAHSIGASEAMTEQELQSEQEAQQKRSRDGGQSL